MNGLIVEDDLVQLDGMLAILTQSFPTISFKSAHTYKAATELIDTENFDFFLLDIELDKDDMEANGIALGQYIRSIPAYQLTPILYLTAMAHKAPVAIHETNCYDYLVKPYSIQMLIESINKLIASPLIKERPLKTKGCDGIYFQIYPDDILYIQSERRIMHIYTETRHYSTRAYRLNELLDELPNYICRCHKSFAVNTNKSLQLDKLNMYIVINDYHHTRIPVGRNYIDLL